MTTSGADDMPPFSHMAVLKAGMVDGVSWMTHGTLVFILRGTTVRAGNRPTPLMINNSESQNYLINIKASVWHTSARRAASEVDKVLIRMVTGRGLASASYGVASASTPPQIAKGYVPPSPRSRDGSSLPNKTKKKTTSGTPNNKTKTDCAA